MQYDEVKELIAIFEEDKDLTELELSFDNVELRLNRGDTRRYASVMTGPMMPAEGYERRPMPPLNAGAVETAREETKEPAKAEKKAEAAVKAAEGGNVVKAPIVGTFYQSASPDKPPFVKVGDKVNKGDVICIIEAMKFMNEIQSDYTGTVTEILVDNEDFVEYGQELFRIS